MYLLGIDISTTATKALISDDLGNVLATASAEYPFETPRPLWSEQHPALWWEGALTVKIEQGMMHRSKVCHYSRIRDSEPIILR